MKKKIIALMLAAALVCGALPAVHGAQGEFSDVPAGVWYTECVRFCAQEGLMVGTSQDVFSPALPMTRGMFVTVLYRFHKAEPVETPFSFEDVAPGAYYAGPIRWAAANGIVNGMSETVFAPDQPVTREQAACMLNRFMAWSDNPWYYCEIDADLTTIDFDEVSDYAKASVQKILEKTIMVGDNHENFRPRDSLSRAEAAMILSRLDYWTDWAKDYHVPTYPILP